MSRTWIQRLGFALLGLAALAVVVPMLVVIGIIVVDGMGAISWEFLTAMPSDGMKQGGIFPAIVGTLLLTLGTALVAIPIGVGGTIYLAEYARDTWVSRCIRLAIINLAGVPSIVHALFGVASGSATSSTSVSARPDAPSWFDELQATVTLGTVRGSWTRAT